jgi:Domain of unknown function (DUF4124)
MVQNGWFQQYQPMLFSCCAAIVLVLGLGMVSEVSATTIYSYIDEKGNAVLTDKPETIPEKYRAKVRTHEQDTSVSSKATSAIQSAGETLKEKAKTFGSSLPQFNLSLKDATVAQSDIINYAGAAAILLLLVMYFSKNSPMIRLLALALLFVLGVGTPLILYTGVGGAGDIMKQKATAVGEAQQGRLQQVP